eukprot:189459-Prymnesium_polylepis.2
MLRIVLLSAAVLVPTAPYARGRLVVTSEVSRLVARQLASSLSPRLRSYRRLIESTATAVCTG